ncbi:SAM hydrolase/SAM-dependent halogenase family protein [Thermocrispum municipale]|uniref:SAM hydrolase/SAM-dependent halogenase family protein n=1 Tax=Thermocrispum municipale TaxID=37926 RepID=UPI00041666B0|nr:SAM-dependent chlorinase/fluorinase [Thermocrispum municipale]
MYEWISFTSDYGLRDPFVGVCHGVIARIAPRCRVIDITHGVPPGNIRHGAFVLAQSVGYLPPAVHLAVVDPGVGTARRGIALFAASGVLIGPDNGLLLPAAEALGGAQHAVELSSPELQLHPVSATFHGRDVFAPAAAHLAAGVDPTEFGPSIPIEQLHRLPTPAPSVRPGEVVASVATIDHFGNVQLTAPASSLREAGLTQGMTVVVQRQFTGVVGRTFADVDEDELVVLSDSAGLAAIAVNGGSAAQRLGLTGDEQVTISSE